MILLLNILWLPANRCTQRWIIEQVMELLTIFLSTTLQLLILITFTILFCDKDPFVGHVIALNMPLGKKRVFSEFFKFFKVNIYFLLIFFILNRLFFLLKMQNCPTFRMNTWFHKFYQIFARLFSKKTEGGVWQLWNLLCRPVRSCQEKVQNSIFIRPALHGANTF